MQVTTNSKLFAFIARTDSPTAGADTAPRGSDYSGRVVLQFHEQPVAGVRRLLAGRQQLQPRGRLSAAARLPAAGVPRVLPAAAEAMAVDPPHLAARRATTRTTASTTAWCRARRATTISSRSSRGRAAGSARSSSARRIGRRAVHGVQRRRQAGDHSAGLLHLVSAGERVPERSERGVLHAAARGATAVSTTATSTRYEMSFSWRVGRAVDRLARLHAAEHRAARPATSTPTSCRSR